MFPTPHTITHVVRTETGENAAGQPTYSETSTSRAVYGWQPVSEQERNEAALAGRVVSELILLTPDGDYASSDRIVIGDNSYEIQGHPEDFTTGPFGFAPGYAIRLRRVTDG